jgi:hypothetical protein
MSEITNFKYIAGSAARTRAIASLPSAAKSSAIADKKVSVSRFREPVGRPPPLFPVRKRPLAARVAGGCPSANFAKGANSFAVLVGLVGGGVLRSVTVPVSKLPCGVQRLPKCEISELSELRLSRTSWVFSLISLLSQVQPARFRLTGRWCGAFQGEQDCALEVG